MIKEFEQQGKSDYNLVQQLEEDETENVNKPSRDGFRKPLYKKHFPEWGRVPANVLDKVFN